MEVLSLLRLAARPAKLSMIEVRGFFSRFVRSSILSLIACGADTEHVDSVVKAMLETMFVNRTSTHEDAVEVISTT